MHRVGGLLMILGANLAVGSLAAAFWRAAWQCAVAAPGGDCAHGGAALFVGIMASRAGLVHWAVVALGLWFFRRGRRMRGR